MRNRMSLFSRIKEILLQIPFINRLESQREAFGNNVLRPLLIERGLTSTAAQAEEEALGEPASNTHGVGNAVLHTSASAYYTVVIYDALTKNRALKDDSISPLYLGLARTIAHSFGTGYEFYDNLKDPTDGSPKHYEDQCKDLNNNKIGRTDIAEQFLKLRSGSETQEEAAAAIIDMVYKRIDAEITDGHQQGEIITDEHHTPCGRVEHSVLVGLSEVIIFANDNIIPKVESMLEASNDNLQHMQQWIQQQRSTSHIALPVAPVKMEMAAESQTAI